MQRCTGQGKEIRRSRRSKNELPRHRRKKVGGRRCGAGRPGLGTQQNRGGKPTYRACRAKRPQRNHAIVETERDLPNAATASRIPPNLRSTGARRRLPTRATNRRLPRPRPRSPPTTAGGPCRALQPDRPRRSTTPPTPAHQLVGRPEARTAGSPLSRRQRRGSHPDSALAIDGDEVAPAVRETLGQRSPSRRAMQGYACRRPWSRLADRIAGILKAHGAARSRRAQIRRDSEGAPGPSGGIERRPPLRTPASSK